MVHLWSYDWPSNVRELEHMIQRLMILCEDSVIDTQIPPANLVSHTRLSEALPISTVGEKGINLNAMVRELEGRLINEALTQTAGNKQAAARLLGLKRTTFAAKLRRCGVIAPSGSEAPDEA
jgi:DNA-binding NtrC family response regulator